MPCSKHTSLGNKINQLMLYGEIIAAFFQIHKESLVHSEGQNIKFVSFKPGGMWNKHRVLKG
jgi:hypothetical protein